MFKLSPISKQFISIVCCNLLTLSYGLCSGWASINFNELQDAGSTMSTGPLSLEEASLVVSLVSVGAFVGNFVILPVSQRVGIKRTIHLCGIPLLLSSVLIIFAQNVYCLYVSRLLTGLVGGCLGVGIPSLINEIAHTHVRGALNSLFDPSYNIGVIISFFLGNFMSCLDQAKMLLVGPFIFISVMFLLPESPEYLTNRNKQERAIKANRFFFGSVVALESAEFLEKTDLSVEKGKLQDIDEDDDDSSVSFRDFVTPQARRAIFISLIALTLNFASGTIVILCYVTDIFSKTGSSLSTKNSSILVSITQITANLIFLNIVERVNRRTLQIGSSILTTISYFLFAAYCMLLQQYPEFDWMPAFFFSCIIYFSWMGQNPIPFIITYEIFPKKIRQTCLSVAISLTWLIQFVLISGFPVVLESYGLFIVLVSFGFISLLNALFGIFVMPETRGKSYEEIMDMFSK